MHRVVQNMYFKTIWQILNKQMVVLVEDRKDMTLKVAQAEEFVNQK